MSKAGKGGRGGFVMPGDGGGAGSGEESRVREVTLRTWGLSLPFLVLADEAMEVEDCSYLLKPLYIGAEGDGRSWAIIVARTEGRRNGPQTVLHPTHIEPKSHYCSKEEEEEDNDSNESGNGSVSVAELQSNKKTSMGRGTRQSTTS